MKFVGRGGALAGGLGNADTRTDGDDTVAQYYGIAQLLDNSGARRIYSGRVAWLCKDHAKLVTAQSRHHIGLADQSAQTPGDLHKYRVAGTMPDGIIDSLKAVQVDEQQCKVALTTPAFSNKAAQIVVERTAIRQSRENVEIRACFSDFPIALQLRSALRDDAFSSLWRRRNSVVRICTKQTISNDAMIAASARATPYSYQAGCTCTATSSGVDHALPAAALRNCRTKSPGGRFV